MLAESHFYFHKAADVLGLSDKVRTILLTPHRTVKVGIAIEGEDGELQSYEGYRVQHNLARGPMKGGLRFHPEAPAEGPRARKPPETAQRPLGPPRHPRGHRREGPHVLVGAAAHGP